MATKAVEIPRADCAQKYGFRDAEKPLFRAQPGLSAEVVQEISWMKGEPAWMRDLRLRALEIFCKKSMPTWGGDLSGVNFDEIYYYVRPTDRQMRNWDDVPQYIKRTFDKLGIPQAERESLAGVGTARGGGKGEPCPTPTSSPAQTMGP